MLLEEHWKLERTIRGWMSFEVQITSEASRIVKHCTEADFMSATNCICVLLCKVEDCIELVLADPKQLS
jgi:hypothetical protein